MAKKLKIDFVSDVVCPWCAIGLRGLETALERFGGDVQADITFHPYELNPELPPEGQVHLDHITAKYGMSADQARKSREQIRQLAANVGFIMNRDDSTRVYNTFDAHRLLAWSKETGKQHLLKKTLLTAYFTQLKNLSNPEVLVSVAEQVGLDGCEARSVIASQRYAQHVRDEELVWKNSGIKSVPTVIVNDRFVISGGNPPDEFERQLKAILVA